MTKNLQIIFGFSLALNLLLIGFIAGHAFKSAPFMPRAHHEMKHPHFQEEALIGILPAEKQNAAREVLAKMHQIREENSARNKADISEVEKIVTAKKFDEKKFLASFKKLSNSMSETKDQCDVELAKFLATLNQEERTNLLKQIQKIHPPFMGRFGKEEARGEFPKK